MSSEDLPGIFQAKERRRRQLAALPYAEKFRQIEALHAVGMELRKLRPQVREIVARTRRAAPGG